MGEAGILYVFGFWNRRLAQVSRSVMADSHVTDNMAAVNLSIPERSNLYQARFLCILYSPIPPTQAHFFTSSVITPNLYYRSSLFISLSSPMIPLPTQETCTVTAQVHDSTTLYIDII
ncbi:hypothetical protein DPMN_150568 [Dreissena polymorpha]|uniref:Uncharacterized protein n=1 Tax=Dreissena polymorpha TaxID=45954 RepID=A0A9D4FET9_DREPO|nr:hypothetical protein DPMN_150568 [Dreissena polymorpha]